MSEKIILIKVSVGTNRVGSECSDEIEVFVEDGLTAEQEEDAMEEAVKEWIWENIDTYWEKISEIITPP